jgi:RNA polymerase sigma-70 factor (ECF subfamily)
VCAPLPSEESAHFAGQARWPDVPLPLPRFCAHVRGLGVGAQELQARAAELYLAVAALDGDPRAINHFERDYLINASQVVTRIDSSRDFLDEVRQQLRVKLFTGERPRLGAYNASGGLVEWLRVVALRVALNIKRDVRREISDDKLELQLFFDGNEAEREALKGRYLADLRRSLEESFRALEPRERTLLRLHFVDGLGIDALGTMYGVHRATAARWLVTIRRSLFERARVALGARLPLESRALRSIYRALEKDLHLTISRVLQSERPAAALMGR